MKCQGIVLKNPCINVIRVHLCVMFAYVYFELGYSVGVSGVKDSNTAANMAHGRR